MKGGQHHDEPEDLSLTDNDPVWRLLAESPRPEPDAWFTARTLALCRREANLPSQAFGHVRRWLFGTGLGVALAVTLVVMQIQSTPGSSTPPTVQDAFEIMASLDTVDSDSSSSSSSWQDSSQ